jgi:ABC-type transport system involved in multi-copper enzyme maturation permease subunit
MLGILITKELKALLLSPKFVATYAVFTVLLLLSTFTGIREYQALREENRTGVEIADQRIREMTSWGRVRYAAYRDADPMQIFVSGVNNDIGRGSPITAHRTVKLENSIYSDDPIYAVFRMIDFGFIVTVVLSLLAILFTYDAVNGEREGGTLRLVFSNAVNRAHYLVAKAIGAWLGLVVPVLVAIALSFLMVLSFNVPMTGAHWMRLGTLVGISLLYFTCFIMFGLFISTFTRRSSVSFLLALVLWVVFVLIIPRASVMAAGQIVSVPAVAEIEGQRDAFAKAQWAEHYKQSEERWRTQREAEGDDRKKLDDEEMWSGMQAEDSLRREVEARIEDYDLKLQEDLRRRKAVQERLALTLSRVSPASAFQLTAAGLAGTDLAMKRRYEDAMARYRDDFVAYTRTKSDKAGQGDMFAITMDTDRGMKISMPRDQGVIDVSDMPRFDHPATSLAGVFEHVIVDFGLLALWILVTFFAAFLKFLRYDMR